VELIRREMQRIHRQGMDREELQRIKNQMKGGLMLSLESTQSRMSKLAKDELYHGRYLTLEEVMGEIDRISCRQVADLAHNLLNSESLSITALGPVRQRSLQQAMN